MIPDRPRLFAASSNPILHAELASTEAILEHLSGSPDAQRASSVVAFVHLFDGYVARAWIREAATGDAANMDLMTPDAQRAEVVRVWQAFANYWRALNVNPLAWMPLRWAFEDAFGHPRSSFERGSGADPRVSPEETQAHYRGVRWQFTETQNGAATDYGASTDDPCGTAPCAREGWFRDRLRTAYLAVTGRSLDGVPIRWAWSQRQLGQGGGGFALHRLRLRGDATVYAHPIMVSPQDWNRRYGDAHAGGMNISETDWRADWRAILDRDGAAYAVPASRWYFDLLRTPIAGLRATPGGRDLSLVDYLVAKEPEQVLRDVRRDVMVLNLRAMQEAGITREDQLFVAARRQETERETRNATATLEEMQRDQQRTSAILTAATTTAAAINPVAGVIAGAVSLIAQINRSLLRPDRSDLFELDVFGRPMPTFEPFALTDARPVLEGNVRAAGLPPGARPDPEVDRARREAASRELDRVTRAVAREGLDGSRLMDPSLRRAGRRTVVLTGLDPAQGARVWVGDRDLTLGLPEAGAAARWTDADGVRVWRFGVPEATSSIRVVYPDGREREIDLSPVPEDSDDPDARTAVVDATPPAGDAGGGLGFPARTVVLAGVDPSRVPEVFAGARRVSADPAPTGDAARWIDTTIPGVRGWLFGVPAGAREVRVRDAEGDRVFPLAPMATDLPSRDRVTVIDARRTASQQPLRAEATSAAPLLVGGVALASLAAFALFRRSR